VRTFADHEIVKVKTISVVHLVPYKICSYSAG
jgi:hypothetical protein